MSLHLGSLEALRVARPEAVDLRRINIGVPAPMAWFPFTGWNQSFFGDLHIQGVEGMQFYTRQKTTMSRWFEAATGSYHDPMWKTGTDGD
jgi:acyl-CoA reductase-like NAD-dependent aldehyde dehydrogenase